MIMEKQSKEDVDSISVNLGLVNASCPLHAEGSGALPPTWYGVSFLTELPTIQQTNAGQKDRE